MLEELKDEVKENEYSNVSFVGRVARELIPSYMNLFDVLLKIIYQINIWTYVYLVNSLNMLYPINQLLWGQMEKQKN